MPVEEVMGGVLGGIARFLGRWLVELVLGVVVQGVGWLLVRPFRPQAAPEDSACLLAGLCFWCVAAAGGVLAWRAVAA